MTATGEEWTTPRYQWRSSFGALTAYTYGNLEWVLDGFPEPAFMAWGWGGKYLYVVPDLDLVVVATTGPYAFTTFLPGTQVRHPCLPRTSTFGISTHSSLATAMQDYSSHRKFVPAFHFITFPLLLATLIGAGINFFKSVGTPGLYSASLILALTVVVVMTFFMMRLFALKAQDRAIRAEENLRHYVRTGSLLDPKLTIRQIIGLRFAADEDYDELAGRAVSDGTSENDIKKAIKNWKADEYRV